MNIYKTDPDIKCLILHEDGEIYFIPEECAQKIEDTPYTIVEGKTYRLINVRLLFKKLMHIPENKGLNFYKNYFDNCNVSSIAHINTRSKILDQLYYRDYDLKKPNIVKFELDKYESINLSNYTGSFNSIKCKFIDNKSSLKKEIDNLIYNPSPLKEINKLTDNQIPRYILHVNGDIYSIPQECTLKINDKTYTIYEGKTYYLMSANQLLVRLKISSGRIDLYRSYFEISDIKNYALHEYYRELFNTLCLKTQHANDNNHIKLVLLRDTTNNILKLQADRFENIKNIYIQNKSSLEDVINSLNYDPNVINYYPLFSSKLSAKSLVVEKSANLTQDNSQQYSNPTTILNNNQDLEEIDFSKQQDPCLILHESGEIYFVPQKYTMVIIGNTCTKIEKKVYLVMSVKDLQNKISMIPNVFINKFYTSYFDKSIVFENKLRKSTYKDLQQELSLKTQGLKNDLRIFSVEKVFCKDIAILIKFKKIKDAYLTTLYPLKNNSESSSSDALSSIANDSMHVINASSIDNNKHLSVQASSNHIDLSLDDNDSDWNNGNGYDFFSSVSDVTNNRYVNYSYNSSQIFFHNDLLTTSQNSAASNSYDVDDPFDEIYQNIKLYNNSDLELSSLEFVDYATQQKPNDIGDKNSSNLTFSYDSSASSQNNVAWHELYAHAVNAIDEDTQEPGSSTSNSKRMR